ncbi:MAG: hypothetical protein HYX25_08120 [Candidatus Solibacter usitatus]|nr:hypothetical protein [Candidatus Solibacter usitatus]
MRTLLATLCFLALCAGQGKSQTTVTVKDYRERITREPATVIKVYVRGLGEGIFWANMMANKKKTPLFCPPPKLALTEENFINILDSTIKKAATRMTDSELAESINRPAAPSWIARDVSLRRQLDRRGDSCVATKARFKREARNACRVTEC